MAKKKKKAAKKKRNTKINQTVEDIFSHAAALTQNGRLRNTIYCLNKKIFILNQDSTVLIHFPLRKQDSTFASPVSFRADDYESKEFLEEGGRIKFITRTDKYTKTKSCKTPERTPDNVRSLFEKFEKPEGNSVILGSDLFKLLDENLSHIEFSARKGKLRIVQRDIYSGSIITITKKESVGLNAVASQELDEFEPIGIRTQDFAALYAFADNLEWSFDKNIAWIESTDKRFPMECVIGLCVYDELGKDE